MASAFGHAALGATLGKLLLPNRRYWPCWVAAACCAALPDVDALGYRLGVPYYSLWGHRGLTHSLLAAAVVAAVGTARAQLAIPKRRPPAGRPAGPADFPGHCFARLARCHDYRRPGRGLL